MLFNATNKELFIVFLLFIAAIGGGLHFVQKVEMLPEGPYLQVTKTAKYLWDNHSLNRPDFSDLYDKYAQESKQQPDRILYQDVFVMGIDGKLYPKHAILISLLAAPFYGLFGDFGFWFFNQCSLFFLLYSAFAITCYLSSRRGGIGVILLLCFGTSLLGHSYTFSFDLLGACFVIAGCSLMRTWPVLGGLVSALSVYIRVTNVLYFPFLFLMWRANSKRLISREMIQRASGFALGLLPLLLLNWLLWGSPISTPYHRLVFFQDGEALIGPYFHEFGWSYLQIDWWKKLFDKHCGLLLFNPALLLLPWLGHRLWKHPARREFCLCFSALLVNSAMIFSYSNWSASTLGNRFLLPAVVLGIIPLLVLFDTQREFPGGKHGQGKPGKEV